MHKSYNKTTYDISTNRINEPNCKMVNLHLSMCFHKNLFGQIHFDIQLINTKEFSETTNRFFNSKKVVGV